MEFKKYNSIENSYRNKFIEKFAWNYDLKNTRFAVLEKIHGSNIQLMFSPSETFKKCSRNRILADDENFQGGLIHAMKNVNTNRIQEYCDDLNVSIRLFGELCGDGIQKGIKYFNDKQILFFDIMINDRYEPFKKFTFWSRMFDLNVVPVVGTKFTLDECLGLDPDTFKSMVDPNVEGDNIAEGFVIRPYEKELFIDHDRFILKQKAKKHWEREQRPKAMKQDDPVVNEWRHKFSEYITENRLLNLFSKMGKIESPKQIGDYIKPYMEDVVEDFMKDYPEFADLDIEKKKKKEIMKFQREIVDMLQNHL